MKRLLSILQFVLGFYFLGFGISHFVLPAGLPEPMGWMYELSPTLHWFSGTAEILAGLALLVLPFVGRFLNLVPLAAAGLVLLMIGAMVWHFDRGETANVFQNLITAGVVGFLAYGRWKLHPLEEKASS